MKYAFLATFAVLVLLSVVAWRIHPEDTAHGKIPLAWVSDDNPARCEQVALFNQLHPEYDLRLDPSNTGMEKVIVYSRWQVSAPTSSIAMTASSFPPMCARASRGT